MANIGRLLVMIKLKIVMIFDDSDIYSKNFSVTKCSWKLFMNQNVINKVARYAIEYMH